MKKILALITVFVLTFMLAGCFGGVSVEKIDFTDDIKAVETLEVGETLQLDFVFTPEDAEKPEVKYYLKGEDGKSTTFAELNEENVLTAKEVGKIVLFVKKDTFFGFGAKSEEITITIVAAAEVKTEVELAVEAAELSKLQADVDAAQILVTAVEDADIKTALQLRLDAIVVEEVVEEKLVTTLKYTGEDTIKFTEDLEDNNAALVGLNPELFTVTGSVIVKETYTNPIGLNKDGTTRLYANREDGEGNVLTVSIAEGYEITKLVITLGEGKNEPVTLEIKLGEEVQDLGEEAVTNNVFTYETLELNTFSLKNNTISESSQQIWIVSILIEYAVVEPIL